MVQGLGLWQSRADQKKPLFRFMYTELGKEEILFSEIAKLY